MLKNVLAAFIAGTNLAPAAMAMECHGQRVDYDISISGGDIVYAEGSRESRFPITSNTGISAVSTDGDILVEANFIQRTFRLSQASDASFKIDDSCK